MFILMLALACGTARDATLFDACMTKAEVLCACDYPWEGSEQQTWCDIDAAKYCRQVWEPMECLPYASELLDLTSCTNSAWSSTECDFDAASDRCAEEHAAYDDAASSAPPDAADCVESAQGQ